jgi:predicted GIY-YIG superfamily endonuclease
VSAQLRLFPLFKPLVERFGQDFFKGAPREPGVYTMRGEEDRILYIGQSKNLRNRLAYYKNANPDRMPRRLVRLVHAVEKITWERCPTAEAARVRELELLRLHRPKFNRADTSPEFFHYINAREDAGCIRIQLHFETPALPEEQGTWRGPIRGRMIPVQALAALQRLWLGAARGFRRCSELPIAPKRMTMLELPLGEGVALLQDFLAHGSEALAVHLLERQSPDGEIALRQLQECDAEILLSWARALKEAQP